MDFGLGLDSVETGSGGNHDQIVKPSLQNLTFKKHAIQDYLAMLAAHRNQNQMKSNEIKWSNDKTRCGRSSATNQTFQTFQLTKLVGTPSHLLKFVELFEALSLFAKAACDVISDLSKACLSSWILATLRHNSLANHTCEGKMYMLSRIAGTKK